MIPTLKSVINRRTGNTMIKRKKDTRTRQTMLGKTLRRITHQHEPNIIRKTSWKMLFYELGASIGNRNLIYSKTNLKAEVMQK